MSISILEKSSGARKRRPVTALVLSGGAVSGGAFKAGGLIAMDLLMGRFSVLDFDMYLGISAGSFLAAPLAAGIPPQEIFASFTGRSEKLESFNAAQFYWPNFGELGEKGQDVVRELTEIAPRAMWALARAASRATTGGTAFLKTFYRKGPASKRDVVRGLEDELGALMEQLPSLEAFVPSGVFDNSRIERFLRLNLQHYRVPNHFVLLEKERRKKLYIHSVDLDTAQDVVFGPDERTDLTISEAVRASTALPGFYRPALINGKYYIDGSAKKTAPIDTAVQKGADLIICYNPFRPYNHTPNKGLTARYGSLGEMGFSKVIDQSIRTLLHSRLSISLQEIAQDPSFRGDVLLLEPAEADRDFFRINPLSFWKRAEAARHGFMTVMRDVERDFDRLQSLLGRYGVELTMSRLEGVAERLVEAENPDDIIDALTKSYLSALAKKPKTENAAAS